MVAFQTRGPRVQIWMFLLFVLGVHFSSDFDGFLAYLAKGNVSFCHHLVSVVLTIYMLISSETAEPYRRNLVGSIVN
jgi:hypothetical protein